MTKTCRRRRPNCDPEITRIRMIRLAAAVMRVRASAVDMQLRATTTIMVDDELVMRPANTTYTRDLLEAFEEKLVNLPASFYLQIDMLFTGICYPVYEIECV